VYAEAGPVGLAFSFGIGCYGYFEAIASKMPVGDFTGPVMRSMQHTGKSGNEY
jgi:hypothetical protein